MNQLILMAAMAFAAVCGGAGQVMMKKASGIPIMQAIPYLLGFAALYGIGVIINYGAYRFGGKASYLYPIIATSYIWVVIMAAMFLSEPLTAGKIIGSIVIVIGVTILVVW